MLVGDDVLLLAATAGDLALLLFVEVVDEELRPV
jgi:hypothetical protein